MTKTAEPEVFQLNEYHLDFTRCRSFGHAWQDLPLALGPNGLVIVTLNCLRCHTHRVDEVSRRSGTIYARRYEYPEGYSTAGMDGVPTSRDEYRHTLFDRALTTASKRK